MDRLMPRCVWRQQKISERVASPTAHDGTYALLGDGPARGVYCGYGGAFPFV